MATLELASGPFVDSQTFSEFVKQVYGRPYSAVQGLGEYEITGNGCYTFMDLEQFEYDILDEEWGDWRDGRSIPFEDWEKLEGWAAHNSGPHPLEMVRRLIDDGHDVPTKFTMLVWW